MSVNPNFWDQQCPVRGAMLKHAHWDRCTFEGGHPGQPGKGHLPDQCCECEARSSGGPRPNRAVVAEVPREKEPGACDSFQFTVSGRCAHCGKVQDDHPLLLSAPQDGCLIDHRSITVRRLIADGGYEWTRCPRCGIQIEPRAITGEGPAGDPSGIARGEIWFRLGNRLGEIKHRIEKGLVGGPDDPDTWETRFHS